MGNTNNVGFFKTVSAKASEHAPKIWLGVGIGSMLMGTFFAASATPKAIAICNELREQSEEEPRKIDYVKATWKLYIPSVVMNAAGVACLIGSDSINAKRNAALAAAYNFSRTALMEYREKVIETIGERKEEGIRDKIADDHMVHNPVVSTEIFVTGKGNTRCYESISGRYFMSDYDKIVKVGNELNTRIINEMYISLNEFYGMLGLEDTSIGDYLGWNTDDLTVELQICAKMDSDGVPCLAIYYSKPPKYKYSEFI